ncbi:hypothetical protein EV426DRAFT_39901 [Tirmania nivea]|nr:hypothetical protein EV426DRAFT_39901 [Tirmania nivea]
MSTLPCLRCRYCHASDADTAMPCLRCRHSHASDVDTAMPPLSTLPCLRCRHFHTSASTLPCLRGEHCHASYADIAMPPLSLFTRRWVRTGSTSFFFFFEVCTSVKPKAMRRPRSAPSRFGTLTEQREQYYRDAPNLSDCRGNRGPQNHWLGPLYPATLSLPSHPFFLPFSSFLSSLYLPQPHLTFILLRLNSTPRSAI